MPDEIVARIRDNLAEARAAARAVRVAARARLMAAETRSNEIKESARAVPERAAAARQRRLEEVDKRYGPAIAELAGQAVRAAERYAPGAATAPWPAWHPTPIARGEVPGPLAVGEVRLEAAPPIPALVPLLDRAHLLITGDSPAESDDAIAALLLRALGCAAPGSVRVTGYDPEQLGGALAGFAPLAGAGVLTFVGPGGLTPLLDELVETIRRINETVLAGEFASLRELATEHGRRPEPWRVAVLLGSGRPDELSRQEQSQLARVLRTGVACGVHLIIRDLPVPEPDAVTELRLTEYQGLPLAVTPPPPELITATCRDLAEVVAAGPEPAEFADLLPPGVWTEQSPWTESSAAGLVAPIGEGADGRMVEVALSDYPPHALIGGPSGTGKTNLMFAWIGALAARYSPDEVEFYLLDFKEGVSFARFAPGQRDPSWLPHVRLVGINANTDREFGLALLRFLRAQLRSRAEAAKKHEVSTLAELRAEDPTGRWPRIVAVVDEFQVLLAGRDALTGEAATLLEDLARRGRAQGIHLVLASQDVSGIEALWGRSGLVGQFALRVALPKARRVLVDSNHAAESIPRHHAVINADSGAAPANRIARIPAAGDRQEWMRLQHRLWRARPPGVNPPRLFDGDAVPVLAEAPDFLALTSGGSGAGRPRGMRGAPAEPVALLGETIDVRPRSARLRLPRAPGRNLAVLGTTPDEACAILAAAGRSLARQYPPGTARFSIACLDADAVPAARDLHAALPEDTGWYDLDSFPELLEGMDDARPGFPHFVLAYAVDAAGVRTSGRSASAQLRSVLHRGPERHTHLLGWWRGVARLRDDLGGVGARLDAIGTWVALDVHGGDLGTLYPKPGGPPWYPRPWRALFFDRSAHREATTIIPYGLS